MGVNIHEYIRPSPRGLADGREPGQSSTTYEIDFANEGLVDDRYSRLRESLAWYGTRIPVI